MLIHCEGESKYEDYDLMKHGLPIKIKAPAEPEVKVTDMGIAKDVTVKKGEAYNIQIISSAAMNYNVGELIENHKGEVQSAAYFSEIIQEDENGFLFERKIDENNISYDFRVVKIIGDNEYNFQRGMQGKFSKEDVMDMYDSVR